jgi:hypothetical protein
MNLPALLTFVVLADPFSIWPAISHGFCTAQFLNSTLTFKTFSRIRFQTSFTRIHLHPSASICIYLHPSKLSHSQFLCKLGSLW